MYNETTKELIEEIQSLTLETNKLNNYVSVVNSSYNLLLEENKTLRKEQKGYDKVIIILVFLIAILIAVLMIDNQEYLSKKDSELSNKIEDLLKPIIKEYSDKGYSLKDVILIMEQRLHYVITMILAERNSKLED